LITCAPLMQVYSQAFDWVQSDSVPYSMNPSLLETAVHFDNVNNRVLNSKTDTVAMIFGSFALGTSFIENRNPAGQLQWQYRIGDLAMVQRMTSDLAGNVYAAGVYQQTLYLGTNDSLEFIIGGMAFQNTFLIKLDPQGNLIWKRNITVAWPDYEGVEALSMDPTGNCWYTLTDFFIAKIVQIDGNGVDQVIHTIDNGKRIGNVSFDPWGGMYVSGAATNGNFIMDTDTFPVTEAYNMFIARYNPMGQPSWAYFGHDVTFQKPMVIADQFGNAFMAGNRYDTTSFNGMFFTYPYLGSDFFALKIDSSGVVKWGLQQPQLMIGPFGTFEQGSNLMVGVDSTGKYYMGGIQRGTVDWGNGFISSTAIGTDRQIAVNCIDVAGKVQWVKMGGCASGNYMHALSVSAGGDCYFTGSFQDTAVFDTILITTTNIYNFTIGKINPNITIGLNEIQDSEVLLYPNPATDFIFLPEELMNSQMEMFDVSGKLINSNNNISDRTLNIEKLVPGIYSLVFRNEKSVTHSKIVVMN